MKPYSGCSPRPRWHIQQALWQEFQQRQSMTCLAEASSMTESQQDSSAAIPSGHLFKNAHGSADTCALTLLPQLECSQLSL